MYSSSPKASGARRGHDPRQRARRPSPYAATSAGYAHTALQSTVTYSLSVYCARSAPTRRDAQATFSELPDVLFFLRVAVAALAGVVAGLAGLQGWLGLAGVLVPVLGVHAWCTSYLEVDAESFGAELADAAGVMPAVGVYVLFWILASRT